VAGGERQAERAAQLFGASEALLDAIGASLWPSNRADYERNLSVARASLSSEAFDAARAKGRAMSLEQAYTYAMEP